MKSISRRFSFHLGAIGVSLALSAPAFAAKDAVYPSAATATVSSVSVDISNDFTMGGNGSTTLDEAVFDGQNVVVTTTWSVEDNSGTGTNTNWSNPRSVTFTTSTTQKPAGASDVAVGAITACTLTSAADSCSRNVSFVAPTTPGNYEIEISVPNNNSPTANTGHLGKNLVVNFSVAEPVALLLDTKLAVAKQCFLLNAGGQELTAHLEELLSGVDIAGANIDFFVNPPSDSIGSATTNLSGTATLSYNVNGLPVGDHNLYAEYAGDSGYNPSNDSNTLGISYLFVGFQPPINPEGNSVFGNGRIIPIKIRLADANGEPVADASPTVWLTQYSESTGLGEVMEAATSVSAADSGNTMRYDPDAGQYVYNWDLSNLDNGTYAVVVDVGDSDACSAGPHHAVITVAKKGKK